MQSGVYAGLKGPSLETPAEIRALGREYEEAAITVCTSFETMGLLVYKRIAPMDLVLDLAGGTGDLARAFCAKVGGDGLVIPDTKRELSILDRGPHLDNAAFGSLRLARWVNIF